MKWLLVLLAVPLMLALGAILLNRVPLWESPGPLARLRVYLGENVAATRPDHPFPELRPYRINAAPDAVRACLLKQMRRLGWQAVTVSSDGLELSAEVKTPLLGFVDDVSIRLQPAAEITWVHARSRSRVGKADFGANLGHLLRLLTACRAITSTA